MSETQPEALLDTSFVVRYLTEDPPEMAAIAAEIIDSDQPLILSEVILAESAYVLSSVYEIPRALVVDTLMSFIQRRNIRLLTLPKPLALEALRLCRDSKRYSFADVLLWAEALHTGVSRIYTFDERFPSTGVERLGVK
ncbi:MAG TPA: type II toxin-antitoxin system VapC family toxin [Caldilineae bacterium]|nr:type II toxin-antitoxin system VapC family toxin [Caldilineae bacterium]